MYSRFLIITKLSHTCVLTFQKSEDEVSDAMKQAAKEAFNSNKTNLEQMKSIARAYATKRECSIQEAVCQSYGYERPFLV